MAGWRARRAAANPAGGAGFRLRLMVAADLPAVLALEQELFPDDPWTADMFADEVVQPRDSRMYLVAEAVCEGQRGRAIAGYAGVMFVPGGSQADVLTIAVAAACWGRGI